MNVKPDSYYKNWQEKALKGGSFSDEQSLELLLSKEVELLPLLQAAFVVRRETYGRKVRVHILNNAKNGNCPEDCSYCVQAKSADRNEIEDYPMKSDEEILQEAKRAHESGAYRYCMVFAGRGPSDKRVERLAGLVQKIKSEYPLQVCVSPGILKEGQAEVLKEAGLDRLNHNLNTTPELYPKICTTHTYEDRVRTLEMARKAGLESCSGLIAGLGEGPSGIVQLLKTLAKHNVPSIPVNFLIDVESSKINHGEEMTPEYALRILCLARFINPKAEVRAAAGRELHLRDMQALSLYPANSIFMEGYLNVMGDRQKQCLKMIEDAGFEIEMDQQDPVLIKTDVKPIVLKSKEELRPGLV